MKSKIASIILILVLTSFYKVSFSQTNDESKLKAYTRQEAIKILTKENNNSVFTSKGNSSELPIPCIGAQILKARNNAQLSVDWIAHYTGLSTSNFQNLENGKAIPTREVILLLEEILKCDLIIDGRD